MFKTGQRVEIKDEPGWEGRVVDHAGEGWYRVRITVDGWLQGDRLYQQKELRKRRTH